MIKEKASKVELSLWFWALLLYTYNVLWYDEGVEVQSDVSGKGLAAGTTGREKAVCCLIRNPHTGHSHPQQCHTRLYIIGKCPVCLSVCLFVCHNLSQINHFLNRCVCLLVCDILSSLVKVTPQLECLGWRYIYIYWWSVYLSVKFYSHFWGWPTPGSMLSTTTYILWWSVCLLGLCSAI